MMHKRMDKMFFCLTILLGIGLACGHDAKNPWTWRSGLGVGAPELWSAQISGQHQRWIGRVAWGGFWRSERKWWSTGRITAGYRLIDHPYYALDLGISGAYSWFQAPDSMAMEINRLYGARILHEVQYRQQLNLGPHVGVDIWGFEVQAIWPVWQGLDRYQGFFTEWRCGYHWKLSAE